jgi:hypothetical protein
MLDSFARFDAFRQHGPAPGFPLSNDNPRSARLPARVEPRQRLACCWQPNAETGRMESHWELSSLSAAGVREQGTQAGTEATPAWMLRVA